MIVSSPAGVNPPHGKRRLLDPRGGDLVRHDAQPLLPHGQQPRAPERDPAHECLRARGGLTRGESVDPGLGELARPPDQLERDVLEVAGGPPIRPALRPPAVQAGEPRGPRVPVRLLELERLARDHEHLDVGHLVCDPAGDAAGDDDLLDHVSRQRVGKALGERAELLAPGGRRPAHCAILPDVDVTLRPVVDSDLPVFFEHQRDPEGVAMAGVPSRDEEAFFAHWEKVRARPDGIHRTIEADGEVAGNIVSWEGDEGRLVGYWIGREQWGRGIATAALRAFLEEIPERPLHALVHAENAGSIRVLEKCGFVQVGEDDEGPVFRLDAGAEPPRYALS